MKKAAEHHYIAERYPDFDRQPAVQPILGDTLAPPEMRVQSLLSIRNRIPWDEVRRGCRPEAWEH